MVERHAGLTPAQRGIGWRLLDAFHDALIAAGATSEDIDHVGAYFTCKVVDQLNSEDADERERHIELIARHLVRTDMTVGLRDGHVTWIQYPKRPSVH